MKVTIAKYSNYAIALLALGISACATPITSSVDVAEEATSGTYKTYAWATDRARRASYAGQSQWINPVNERRVRVSIEQELSRKGYQRVPLDRADLAVGFTLDASDRTVVRNNFDNFGSRYNGFRGGFSRFGPRFSRFGSNRFGFNRFGFRGHGFGGHRFGGYGFGGHGFGGRGFGSGFDNFGSRTSVRTFTEGTLVVDFFDNTAMEAIWHGSATKRLSRDENGKELIADAVGTLLDQFPDRPVMAAAKDEITSS